MRVFILMTCSIAILNPRAETAIIIIIVTKLLPRVFFVIMLNLTQKKYFGKRNYRKGLEIDKAGKLRAEKRR
jgi:hypothetical protein